MSVTETAITDMEDLLRPQSQQSSQRSFHNSAHNSYYINADSSSWKLTSQKLDHVTRPVSAALQQDTLLSMDSPADYQHVGNIRWDSYSADERDQVAGAPLTAEDVEDTSLHSAQYLDASQSVSVDSRECR